MNINRNDLVGASHEPLPVVAGGTVLTPDFIYEGEANDAVDLRKLWSAIWRHRLIIVAIVAAFVTLGILALFLANPIYRATASVEIDNQPVKVLGTEDYQQISSSQETDRMLQTQVDILRSRALAEKVAADLSLDHNRSFLEANGIKPESRNRRERVIDAVKNNLVVTLPHNTRVVPVSFESRDPAIAAKVANRLVENLISGNLQRHFDTSRYSKDFLQNQLELTKGRLEESEQALLNYARSVGIVDPTAGAGDATVGGSDTPRSLTTANLVDVNQSLAAAKSARIQAEGRWREAAATPTMNLPDVLGNPAIQQMTQRRAELQSQYQQELQHRKADHPAVQQAAAAIQELDRQISSLAGSIRNSIRNQYNTAVKQESELTALVGRLKGATLAEQQLGIKYNILKREVDTNRELYNGLLQRYKEVSAESGVTSNNISIVDRAQPPLLPVSPRPLLYIALAGLIGMVVAALTVAALEIFRDGIRTPEEVEAKLGVPLLGHTPLLASGGNAAIELLDRSSPVSEAYQTVRTSIELSTEAGTPKTLAITSSRPGEGKSTTALAMARDAALDGRKVLLIDADMRRPSLYRLLNVPNDPGLSIFLTQQLPVENVIRDTDTPGLHFMAAGPKPPSPAELLSGNGMRAVLGYLSNRYDQIIIDCPPVLGLADAPRLASIVDATVMVVEANRSQRGAIDAALRRLAAARARLIGAVLVKFDARHAEPGSSYLTDYYGYGEDDGTPARFLPAENLGG